MERPRFQPAIIPLTVLAIVGVAHQLVADLPMQARWAGLVPLVAGLAIATWAIVHQFRRGMNPEIHKPTPSLIVDGPYAVSRNPIYLGFVAASVGLAWFMGWWLIVVGAPAMVWGLRRFIIDVEERALASQFQDAYEQYRQRVRRWL